MEFIVGTLLCLATFTQWFCDSSIFLPLLVLIDIFSQLSNVILYESTIFHFLLLLFFLVLYWFCHISTWIRHGCTRALHPEHSLPPPTPYQPSGSSQCSSPKHPVSCMEPGLAIHFIYDIIHVSMPFFQIIPPSPSPTESKRLFYTSVSLLLSCIQGYC